MQEGFFFFSKRFVPAATRASNKKFPLELQVIHSVVCRVSASVCVSDPCIVLYVLLSCAVHAPMLWKRIPCLRTKCMIYLWWNDKFLILVWTYECEISNESLRSCEQTSWLEATVQPTLYIYLLPWLVCNTSWHLLIQQQTLLIQKVFIWWFIVLFPCQKNVLQPI